MRSDHVALTALAGLDGMGPKRLDATLRRFGPVDAWSMLQAGRSFGVAPTEVETAWRAEAQAVDLDRVADALAGVVVSRPGDPDHPVALTTDIDPAPVLYRRGRPIDPTCPAVAIVGTRRASAIGREVARELGFGLAAAGVAVVSGLALGIDGAAHEGALLADGAPPVAFVGGGPDIVYPKAHGRLWEQIVARGTLASEAPPGAPPTRWRFPARNRLIAAVADLVVVVESRRAGGSLLTVDEAIRRDRQVMAVPGSVRNGAAAGTNALLADGCAPVLSVDDVLAALGLSQAERAIRRQPSVAPELPSELAVVFDAIDDGATSVETVVERVGVTTMEVMAAIGELTGRGLVVDDGARVRRA